jgi:TolB-like protein/DNA-binding winged helix-turn-helix (wHTH) protein/Tfp pilus assembly protein PilF
MASSASVRIITFADFEVKLGSGELCRKGVRIRLPDQSFRILAMLLERPGELVTREEIRKRLWPGDTFVDFDHGLNNAVNRLREALHDSAANPLFIETLPRRGYRFIGAIDQRQGDGLNGIAEAPGLQKHDTHPVEISSPRRTLSYIWIPAGLLTILMVSLTASKFLTNKSLHSNPIHSLAVLPLENLSGDPAQDYLADGISDALITQLARIGSLRVISRTSVVGYKGTRKPLGQIARELNVDAVVEGSVVRSGNRVSVNAQLIQAVPERHLWANDYERNVADIVEFQNDLARAIAGEIQIQLTPGEQAHFATHSTVNSEAYNAYLLGRFFLDRSGKDLPKAAFYYEQAIHFDPNYAPAWAGLADTYRYLGGGGYMPDEEAERKARESVERAIQLDPQLAEAHAALGSIQTFVDWDWTAADASFQRALALEPGNVSALRGAAFLAANLGQFEKAITLARQAVERDPLNFRSYRVLSCAAGYAGKQDEALAALKQSVQLHPQGAYAHTDIAWIYLTQSHPRAALEEVGRETAQERSLLGRSVANYALGQKKKSDAALDELIAKLANVSAFQIAEAYAFRGERDKALKWLERAYRQRDGALVTTSYDPLLKSLHGDPRFTAFLKKMRLPS